MKQCNLSRIQSNKIKLYMWYVIDTALHRYQFGTIARP